MLGFSVLTFPALHAGLAEDGRTDLTPNSSLELWTVGGFGCTNMCIATQIAATHTL